jgi:hypothetical protein
MIGSGGAACTPLPVAQNAKLQRLQRKSKIAAASIRFVGNSLYVQSCKFCKIVALP